LVLDQLMFEWFDVRPHKRVHINAQMIDLNFEKKNSMDFQWIATDKPF